jgi:hypothetical protein
LFKRTPVLINAPVGTLSLCVGAPLHFRAPRARLTESGKQACELCGRQLGKVKHHRPHGVGRACNPRCKPQKHALTDAEEKETPPPRAHKRAKSDPSKSAAAAAAAAAAPAPLLPRSTRPHRVCAPKPPPKQSKEAREAQISALLDATVARRAALEEAVRIATADKAANASAVVWQ